MPRRRSIVPLVLVLAAGCSASRSSPADAGAATPSDAGAGAAGPSRPGNARPGSQTRFDFSAQDIFEHSLRPWEQSEFAPARNWSTGCDRCTADQFCDIDHCARFGSGGTSYLGGSYGGECIDDPADPRVIQNPRLVAQCGVHRCIEGSCRSCRSDEDCCLQFGELDSSCRPGPEGDFVCLYWDRIQSNACIAPQALPAQGVSLPLTPARD